MPYITICYFIFRIAHRPQKDMLCAPIRKRWRILGHAALAASLCNKVSRCIVVFCGGEYSLVEVSRCIWSCCNKDYMRYPFHSYHTWVKHVPPDVHHPHTPALGAQDVCHIYILGTIGPPKAGHKSKRTTLMKLNVICWKYCCLDKILKWWNAFSCFGCVLYYKSIYFEYLYAIKCTIL